MAIRCGFFHSINQDRVYSADDLNEPHIGIIPDGIFTDEGSIHNQFEVTQTANREVTVKPGSGVFGGKWVVSDSDVTLTFNGPNGTSAAASKIASVVLRVDTSDSSRLAKLAIIYGATQGDADAPTPPALTRTDTIKEYRLANIYMDPTASPAIQVIDTRDSEDCGWITGLIYQLDVGELKHRYQSDFDDWFAIMQERVGQSNILTVETAYGTFEDLSEEGITMPVDGLIHIEPTFYDRTVDYLEVYVDGVRVPDSHWSLVRYDYDDEDGEIEYILVPSEYWTVGSTYELVVFKIVEGTPTESVLDELNTMLGDYIPRSTGGTIEGQLWVNGDLSVGGIDDGGVTGSGTIRVGGYQAIYTDMVTNMQFGTASMDTRINGENDIYFGTRANTLSFIPQINNEYQLGNSTNRYRGLYLVSDANVSSDERLKQNVQSVNKDDMLTFIDSLEVVNYEFKSDAGVERMGVIAQQVESVGGDIFVEVGEDGMYGLNEEDLLFPLIGSVQALADRVDHVAKKLKKGE